MNNTIQGGGFFPPIQQPTSASPTGNTKESGFTDVLRNAVEQVEQMSTDAQGQVKDLLAGDRADVHNVMIAVQKADVAFQFMMQVRNKIVNAYQEIERMQF